MAQTSTVGLAQGVRVEEVAWYSSELVDNVDAQATDEVIFFSGSLTATSTPVEERPTLRVLKSSQKSGSIRPLSGSTLP